MKIVHVHHHYWPVVGGLERSIESIAKELVKLGHDVHVITSMFGAEGRPREEVVDNVYIHRVEALRLHFPDLTIPLKVPREVLEKADVIICWNQNSYFTYRVCKDAKRLRKTLAVYFIGVDYLKHHYNPFIRVFGFPYQKWITQKIARLADVALTTNEYEKKLLEDKYSVNAIVLPHGIDEEYLKLPNMAETFRNKYGIYGRIITYIGRIHPTKGLDLLLKAFAYVAREVPDTILVIAGRGDDKYLRRCLKIAEKAGVRDRLRILGYIGEEDKIALIDASDIIVLPTKHAGESFPLIIPEVLARGKDIIITSGSIASIWIRDLGIARVVEANHISIAKAVIEELGKSREVINIRSYFNKYIYTWSQIANNLAEILQKLHTTISRH